MGRQPLVFFGWLVAKICHLDSTNYARRVNARLSLFCLKLLPLSHHQLLNVRLTTTEVVMVHARACACVAVGVKVKVKVKRS
eukprot:scaffold59694_cov31-Tisochrysis_lutea.AAC.1